MSFRATSTALRGSFARFVRKWGRARLTWIALAAGLLVMLMFAVVVGPSTTVHLDVITEVVRLETVPSAAGVAHGSRPIDWHIGAAEANGCTGNQESPQIFSLMELDRLSILPGARITMERLQDSDTLNLRVESLPDYTAALKPTKCGAALPVRINNDQDGTAKELYGKGLFIKVTFATDPKSDFVRPAIVLPVDARVQAGQEVGEGSVATLESGSISIHASHDRSPLGGLLQFLGRRRTYVAERMDLQRGDSVSIPEEGIARGYLRIPAKGSIQLAAFGVGDRATVFRAGNARIEIAQSFWSRVGNEPALGGVLALLALWFGLLEVALKLREVGPERH